MLVDVTIGRDPLLDMIANINGRAGGAERIDAGLYLCGHWNFEHIASVSNTYPDLPDDMCCYGVCDSPNQLVSAAPWLSTSPTKYVVSFVKIEKALEPKSGGWRWHKWGSYIGNQDPQCEYLADEPTIDVVYTYHIYEVKN